jgi:hypothetical protein
MPKEKHFFPSKSETSNRHPSVSTTDQAITTHGNADQRGGHAVPRLEEAKYLFFSKLK